ncbi:MAG: hypothetical protein OEU92_32455, partial [Alphaproteobacteria bacterium]|nr:hypothetical protein [Alphaproteobacteria bacterium]
YRPTDEACLRVAWRRDRSWHDLSAPTAEATRPKLLRKAAASSPDAVKWPLCGGQHARAEPGSKAHP